MSWLRLALIAAAIASGPFGAAGDDATQLAKAAQNPVADLISLPFQNNTDFDFGPRDRTLNVLNVQPVLPIGLTEEWNLITRTILPIVSQPSLRPGQDRRNGLGDTTVTGFLSPAQPGRLVWGVGPALLLPTSTSDRLGADAWGAGPSAVVLAMPGDFVLGSLVSNLWSIGGSGDDVNLFTWQYFVNYNLGDGWYLVSAPVLTADWEADRAGDRWTVPFGGGFGKIFRLAGLPPMNAQVQGFYNAEKPSASGRFSLRLQLQLMFPRPK